MAKNRSRKELSSDLIQVFVRALNAPATFAQAAAITGFSERTLRSWIAAGEDENCTDDLLIDLAHQYAKVMSSGKRAELVNVAMELALTGDQKMLAMMLKAYIPAIEPATSVKVEATHELKKPARNLAVLSESEVMALEAIENKMLSADND